MASERWIAKAYKAILDGDFQQAVVCFEEAVRLEPDNAEFHYKLSVTCSRSGRLDRALSAAQKAAELAPENVVYREQLQQVMAKELTARASVLMGSNALLLGLEWEWNQPVLPDDNREADHSQAITMLRRAIQMDPLSADAYLLLAVACGETGDVEGAFRNMKEALRLNPGLPTGKRLMAVYTGRLAQSIKEAERKRRNDHGQLYH